MYAGHKKKTHYKTNAFLAFTQNPIKIRDRNSIVVSIIYLYTNKITYIILVAI